MNIQEIKNYMKDHNISQIELAQKSNIPLQTIRKIFSGHTANPRIDTMQAIERALDIDNAVQTPPHVPTNIELTADEAELLAAYRKLIPTLKEYAREIVSTLSNVPKTEAERRHG